MINEKTSIFMIYFVLSESEGLQTLQAIWLFLEIIYEIVALRIFISNIKTKSQNSSSIVSPNLSPVCKMRL